MKEVLFEILEDEIDGGFVATCLGHSIVTQAERVEELRAMIKDAVHCHFGDGAAGETPRIIRLHFVRDEVLIAGRSRGTLTALSWLEHLQCWATKLCAGAVRASV
jgi:predicted RNase H-like HicB family nuclease